jgi:hypothetical protein
LTLTLTLTLTNKSGGDRKREASKKA